MSSIEQGKNSSSFYITLKPFPHLDGRFVIFGEVTEGMDVLKKASNFGSPSGKSRIPINIEDCGELK